MVTEEKKLFNFRPIFFCFIGLILGIISVVLAFKKQYIMTDIILFIFLLFSSLIILGVFFKTKFLTWFVIKSKVFFCIVIAIIIGATGCYFQVKNYNDASFNYKSYEISGRICDLQNYDTEFVGLILENCKANEKSLNKNIFVFCYDADINQLGIGDLIKFTSRLECVNIIPEEKFVNNFYLSTNVGYVSSFSANNMEINQGELLFDEIVREKVKNYLYEHMGADSAEIAIAVLIGDKDQLNEFTKNYYSASGISHLLAISGLHIGFIVALIYLILKKIKTNKYFNFMIITILLLIYCYICGFPSSVVRASIMSVVFLLSTIIGERSDGLTNLSIAGIVLLLVNPLQVFNLGFQLSFVCVFGIFCLYKPVFKFFDKLKLPKIINAPMSISFICQLVTLPLVLNNFEFISAFGIITNLFCLPLFSFAFSFLIVATILGVIVPIFSFLLLIPEVIFTIITGVAQFISSINFGVYKFISFSLISILIFILLIYLISNFFLIKKKNKLIINVFLTLIFIFVTIVSSMPAKFNELTLLCSASIDNFTVLTTQTNNTIMINIGSKGTESEYEYIKLFLKNNKIHKIDALVFVNYKSNTRNNLIKICQEYNIDNLLLPNTLLELELTNIEQNLTKTNIQIINNNQVSQINNIKFNLHYMNALPKAMEIDCENSKLVFCSTSMNAQEINFVKNIFGDSMDILRVNNYNKSMWEASLKGKMIIANTILAVPLSNYINLSLNQNLIYRVEK